MFGKNLCESGFHKYAEQYLSWDDGFTSGGQYVDICVRCNKRRTPKWIKRLTRELERRKNTKH